MNSDRELSDSQLISSGVYSNTDVGSKLKIFPFNLRNMAALAALLNIVSLGMVSAFSAPATVDMKQPGSRFSNITNSEVTWIASLPGITAIFGNIFSGYLSNKFGRKTVLMFVSAPFLTSWLVIAYAPTMSWIYGGRLLAGLCTGICSVSVPAYIIEIASVEIRGLLGSCFHLSYTIGVLITMSFGIFFRWTWLAVIGGLFNTCAVILMYFMPESPPWLISEGKYEEATEAFRILKGKDVDTKKEYDVALDHFTTRSQKTSVFYEFKEPELYKPIVLAVGLMFFQQFSGISALMAYTVEIFEHAESALEPSICAAIVAGVQFFATLIGSVLMDKAGRRILYLISGTFVTVGLVLLGIYGIVLEKQGFSSSLYGWIPLIGFTVFVGSFSLGFGPIPYLMTPEFVPLQSRAAVLSIAGVFSSFFLFIVTKTFDDLRSVVSDYGVFWVYGSFSCLGCLFCWFCIPETKMKTLSDIHHTFKISDIPTIYEEI